MACEPSEAISSEELRRRLYQTFKSRGVLDSLKSQLRNQLVHELARPVLSGDLSAYHHHHHHHHHSSADTDSLLIKASNSIVADHLRRIGYQYTLSVFYPECGLEKEKVFSTRDLLQILKICPGSDLYKSTILGLQNEHEKGFLVQLLMEFTEYHQNKQHRDAEAQTRSIPEYRESLADKFQLVDEEYAALSPTCVREDFWEAKLLAYRKQVEEQLQAEMYQEMQRFKDVEVAKIQLEEKERSQKQIDDLKWKLDKTYQTKSETLITREKNAIERLQKQQEIEEKEIYAQRQGLLKDIEVVRLREAELNQRIETVELTQKLHEQKNKCIEEDLRRRELAVKNIEDRYEEKLENEMCRYQLEVKEDYLKRTEQVIANEKRNEAEAAKLSEESAIIQSKRLELQQAIDQIKKLQVELNAAEVQVDLLNKQNELLNEKLKDVGDYALLKTQQIELRTEIKHLRQHLDKAECENHNLHQKLHQPTPEYLALQAELKRAECARKLDQDECQSYKQILEQQLKTEVEQCAQLQSQLIKFEDQTRRLSGQVDDLKLQLQQTQLALENEVYRNPKSSLVDRSAISLTPDRTSSHDIYVDAGLLKNQVAPEDHLFYSGFSLGRSSRRHTETMCSSPDSDLDFVAGAKARISELEKESENLEEAYRNYQRQIIRSAVQKNLESGTLSPLHSILSRVPSSHNHKVTFADCILPSQHLELTTPRGYTCAKSNLTEIENHTHPVNELSSQSCCSSTNVTQTDKNEVCMMRIEAPQTPGSQISATVADEFHSCGSEESIMTEDLLADDVSHQVSADLRLEELDAQPDCVHKKVKQRPIVLFILVEDDNSIDEESLSQSWDQQMNNGSFCLLNHKAILSPPDKKKTDRTTKEWEQQRRQDEERRFLERQEAWEREQKELERLEQEKRLMEEKPIVELSEQTCTESKGNQVQENKESPALSADPLEKYMKIIQEQRALKQEDKSLRKEGIDEPSLLHSLSDGKNASFETSHEEADDNFW
ncbi:oral-facial-digital syndrome 1 protein homolog [Callorhinchus milii]|uniref:oral-facial-digital syndrome 1 protein homolog n=1 Tax=Callorhinchus milii TaxID=7868 RepID=UPI001C3FA129|nr:oral-facial-digital syndrome 1 protein homolog [Callorhinchus milii]